MNCPDCQRHIPSDSLFCCYCGQSLQVCTSCERFFPSEAAFCGTCGGQLTAADTPRFEPPQQPGEDVAGYLYELTTPPTHYPLTRGDNTVGAGGNNDIVIDRPPISWNHAILICRAERILLQDSASTNGTFLNGDPIRAPRPLSHGDIVRFGSEEFHTWLRPSMRDDSQ